MRLHRHSFLLGLGLMLATGAVSANASQPETRSASPSKSSAPRAISAETAARIGAATPKYNPPAPAKAAETLPDLREIDKPRNTIIRLPPFVVQEKRAPYLPTEREMRTDDEQRALALKRYPGFRVGNIFGFNAEVAVMMMKEEERLAQKRQDEDSVELFRYSDPATYERVRLELEKAYQRAPAFGPSRTSIDSPFTPFGAHGSQKEPIKNR